MNMQYPLITARKRSLGQGNIFAPIGHSVHGGVPAAGGGGCSWGVWSWGVPARGGVPAPGGLLQGGVWWRPPGLPLLRAVRIPLECILVPFAFCHMHA